MHVCASGKHKIIWGEGSEFPVGPRGSSVKSAVQASVVAGRGFVLGPEDGKMLALRKKLPTEAVTFPVVKFNTGS